MTVNDNKVVSLIYTLEVEGAVKDQTTVENPLEFIFGVGSLLPLFEDNIKDMTIGDHFDFNIEAKDGYGEYTEEAIVDLAKNIFEIDGKINEGLLEIGNVVPMMNSQGGVIPGKVLEVTDDSVKMDFNHELAGKNLHFTGEIIALREATDKELTEGLHGERAPHDCGGDCSSCGSNCH